MNPRDQSVRHDSGLQVLYNYVIGEFGESITSGKENTRETNIWRLLILYCNEQSIITMRVSLSIYRGEVPTSSRTLCLVKLPTYGLGFFLLEIFHTYPIPNIEFYNTPPWALYHDMHVSLKTPKKPVGKMEKRAHTTVTYIAYIASLKTFYIRKLQEKTH